MYVAAGGMASGKSFAAERISRRKIRAGWFGVLSQFFRLSPSLSLSLSLVLLNRRACSEVRIQERDYLSRAWHRICEDKNTNVADGTIEISDAWNYLPRAHPDGTLFERPVTYSTLHTRFRGKNNLAFATSQEDTRAPLVSCEDDMNCVPIESRMKANESTTSLTGN